MNTLTDDQAGVLGQRARGTPAWIWILAAVVICCLLSCAGVVGFVLYFGRAPENFTAEYSMPSVVTRGEEFDLVISMTNTGTEPIQVGDIDLDESFGGSILDGSIVLSTEPDMERDYSLSGIKTFKYDRLLRPGASQTVVFHLQATTPGEFGGSVGIYIRNLAFRIDYISLIVQEP